MADTIVITGATSGIGWELAHLAFHRGATVHVVGRNAERLAALELELPRVVTHRCDLADIDDVMTVGERIAGAVGSVTTLFNNAAVQYDCAFGDADYDVRAAAAEATTNFVAPVVLTRALWSALEAASGSVVMVSSGLAIVPKRSAAVYCASKSGLSGVAAALARQQSSVRVIDAILPLVDTPMTTGRSTGKLDPAVVAERLLDAAQRPSGRVGIGKARALPALHRLSPKLARRLLDRP